MDSNYIINYFLETFMKDRSGREEHFSSISYDGTSRLFSLPENRQESFLVREGDLEFCFTMNVYPEYNAVEWQTTVTNRSDQPSGILSHIAVMDVKIPLPFNQRVIHKGLNGDSCSKDSFHRFEQPLTCGQSVSYRPIRGKSSHFAFPFFDICGEKDGLICGIGWSGFWYYELKRTEAHLIIKAGLPDARFYVKPQETLRLPRILLMGYKGGYREGHNRFRRLMKEHYSPKPRFGHKMQMPIALQNYDRYSYDTPSWNTEEAQLKQIDFAGKCGHCDTYWLDAAWFQGGFPRGVGNYSFREGFPKGLTNISAYAHEKGLRVMVWFEPERVYYGTELEKEHPEFVLKSTFEDTKEKGGRGRLFNLSDPKAVDWLIDWISGFIERYEIDIYRQDFNIYPDTYWAENDEPNRVGITEIKYLEGEYRFLDTLLERFPHLMIDNCASGGNRMDLEACMRSVFCWRSDIGCAQGEDSDRRSTWNQNQTMGLSDYIVYHAIATWDLETYDVRSSMTNGFAPNFDIFAPDFDFEKAGIMLAECERLRNYYAEDFYPISQADLAEDHWAMYQFGTKESGVMLIFRREQAREERQTVFFRGLDTEKEYLLRITDDAYQITETMVSGKKLEDGIEVSIDHFRGSLTAEYIKQ